MLEVNQLFFGYGEEPILKGIDFQADPKEVISLIGPNGSGKSTLLRCLCGLLPVKDHSILLKGCCINRYKKRDLARKMAFLPQSQEKIQGVAVRDLVAFGRMPYQGTGWYCSPKDREAIDWALDYMQITQLQHRMINTLSGGELQRVRIAMALAQDTSIILLDEPVTYMDLKYQWDLLETIHQMQEEFGKTIISVFHDINHALEVSHRVYMMQDGRIYTTGAAEEVVTEESLMQVYGVRTHIGRMKGCGRPVVVPKGRRRRKGFKVHQGRSCSKRYTKDKAEKLLV